MSSPLNRTPESLNAGLRRKDSKNALTTCHGVTDKGRACRRPIAGSKAAYGVTGASTSGAMVIPEGAEDPAVFFCYQHKDQAELLNFGGSEIVEVNGNERGSLEDAFSKLGLEEVEEEEEESEEELMSSPSPTKRLRYDAARRLSSPERVVASGGGSEDDRRPVHRHRRRSDYVRHERRDGRYYSQRKPNCMSDDRPPKRGGFWSALLGGCFQEGDTRVPKQRTHPTPGEFERHKYSRDDPFRQARHSAPARTSVSTTPRVSHSAGIGSRSVATPASIREGRHDKPRRNLDDYRDKQDQRRDSAFEGIYRGPSRDTRPSLSKDSRSGPFDPTTGLLTVVQSESSISRLTERRPVKSRSKSSPGPSNVAAWIPEPPAVPDPGERDAKLNLYARLLTEMSKKPTPKDAPGYIYIFWQTGVEQTDAETAAAASLISAPTNRLQRSEEEILARRFFQTSANARLPPKEKRTIFFKIGRAINVHQRLNQWQKQCQYSISLLRSYPFAEDGRAVVMVPYVGKVESLIHLELVMLGKRVKRQCRCGTEHREWFEFDATPKAVREVDELVRKWIRWSQAKDWEK
jgi:hypothetical protein